MRIKLLVVLCLSTFLFLAGCRGDSNTNNANVKPMATPTPTAIAKTTETPATDAATVKKIEDALKAKGFTDVKVDGTTKPITLRGTVAKNKMDQAVQTAQEAAGTPVKNELTEK